MNFDKLVKILASMALAAFVTIGFATQAGPPDAKPAPAKAPAADKAPTPEKDKAADKDQGKPARVVELKVTENGFEPSPITVKKGEPLKLRITRLTEETCAKDLMVPEYGIEKDLPMNKAVEVEFTPNKAGKLKYGCSMGLMIAGVLLVE